MKKISLVIPAYNEQNSLEVFYDQLVLTISKLNTYQWEIVFVNDGSSDRTREYITVLAKTDPRIVGINFSRNFGKELAITAGIENASGDAVITLDADGQHPVEKLALFLQEWEKGFDIVYNKRPQNEGAGWMKNITSKLFYSIFNRISEFKLESQTTDYRLLDRKVVDVFLQFTEKNRLYRGLIDRIGFNKKALEFDALSAIGNRKANYNYAKLFTLALNSITSFSVFPLKIVGHAGVALSFLSFLGLIWVFFDRITGGVNFTNLGLFTLINTFLIGIVMISLGMIAVYIANIHDEVRGRPLYIIKEKIG